MAKNILWTVIFSVFLIGAGLYLGFYAKHAIDIKNHNKVLQFVDKKSTKIATEIHSSIYKYQYGLRGLLGAIEATGFDNFNYKKQLNYFNSRDYAHEFPGTRGFGLIKLVKKSDLAKFLKDASEDRGREFNIKQLDSPKEALFIIQYIEPEINNNSAVGLDIGSESNRRIAALRAAKSGELQLTGPITLVQATDREKHGFLLLYPIYNNSKSTSVKEVLGWVYAPLLIHEILDTVSEINGLFNIQISDKTATTEVEFYNSQLSEDLLNQYQRASSTKMFGREWLVTLKPTHRFVDSLVLEDSQSMFWKIVIGTFMLNILLIVTSIFLSNRLQKLKQQLAFNSVVNNASDGIIGVDNNFAIQHWNNAADQLFDLKKNNAINKPIAYCLSLGIRSEKLVDYFKKVSKGETLRNLRFTANISAAQEQSELLIHISPIYQNKIFSGATAIFNDVTEIRKLQKRLESNNADLEKKVTDSAIELNRQFNLQKSILNSNQSIIIATDNTGLISLFNKRAEELLGYSSSEVLAQLNIVNLLAKDNFPIALPDNKLPSDLINNYLFELESKQFKLINCSMQTVKNKMFPVHLIISQLTGGDHLTEGYVFIATDQSDKQNLEDEMSLISAAIDTSQDFLFWTSIEGKLIRANSHAIKTLSTTFTSKQNPLIDDALIFSPKQSWQVISSLVLEKGGFTFEAELKLSSGTLPVMVCACLINMNDNQIIYFAAKSIVERINKEKQLKTALDSAESGNNAKTKFIANISHELRTPLNAAKGYLQLLEMTKIDELQRNHVGECQKAVASLTNTIDEIMEVTLAENNHLTFNACDFVLDELLNEIGMLLYEMSGEKALEIHFNIAQNTPYTLYGDRNKLKKILINVAGNAVKFSQKGEVLINLAVNQIKNQDVILDVVVKDNGIGIDASKLDSIFDSFTQEGDETTRLYGGLGIGLSIANKYVNFLGGNITISSQVGIGTEVHFDVKLQHAHQLENSKLVSKIDRIINVLLVDDNETSLRILSATVTQFGWKVTTANNASDALLLFESAINHDDPFDLALIDWKMPDTDGWELAALFRKVSSTDKMPLLIMVTAHSKEMFKLKQKTLPNILNGFLTKPITRIQLLEAFYDAVDSANNTNLSKELNSGDKPLLEMRILVVDDNPTNLQVAKSLLESQGASTVIVNGGQEALVELENSLLLFDLVLMDIQMPVMDGYEATRRIREINKFKYLPIIAMTANVLASDKEKCFEAGMNEHIGKPIELKDMLNKILTITKQELSKPFVAVESTDIETKTDVESFCDEHQIDFKNAMARFNNLESMYIKSLMFFTSDLQRYIEQLEDVNTSQSDLKMMFHTLKGTAGALGIVTLTNIAIEQEIRVIEASPDNFDINFFKSNSDSFKKVQLTIVTLIDILDQNQNLVIETQESEVEYTEAYAQLKNEINSFNMHAIDTFQTIASTLKSLYPELSDDLLIALNKLKFKDAKEIIKLIDDKALENDYANK